ncbi:MAG: SprT-like domain-containing protein [Deltaproteobacteria bacterium]|nr:SprT-like domain-containing protein [Deltaproteobacteria bacterium]
MKTSTLRRNPTSSPLALSAGHQRLLARWLRTWKVSRLSRELRVEFSPRLRRAFGRCYQSDRLIRLTPSLLGAQSYLMTEVLCHEAAHAAVFERYGSQCQPHGQEWRELMAAVGFEARVRIPVVVRAGSQMRSAGRSAEFFVLRCPVCRSSRTARRPMQSLRCTHCTRGGRTVAMKVETAQGRPRRRTRASASS